MVSADYEEKPSGGILTGTGCTWKEAEWTLQLSKRTLQSKGCLGVIRNGRSCLIIRQLGSGDATFLLEVFTSLILEKSVYYNHK
jgi:hypothetical protein